MNLKEEAILLKKTIFLQITILLTILVFSVSLAGCFGSSRTKPNQTPARTDNVLVLATTTSVNDSGLMRELKPLFEKKYQVQLKIISVGSGQALEEGRRGNADVVFTHDPKAEKQFVDEGFGLERKVIMSNYFMIVGSSQDPAMVKGIEPLEALRKIASTQSPFISRDDNSGTNKREEQLWERADIQPQGNWYLRSGSGQGPTLLLANQKGAYTLTDKATYLNLKNQDRLPNLERIVDSPDTNLLNVYSVMVVNPQKVRGVNHDLAQKFSDFMLNKDIQERIGNFGKQEIGESLFIPRIRMPEQ